MTCRSSCSQRRYVSSIATQPLPGRGATYVAGSIIHHYQGAPPRWPERAVVGPVRWIDLLTDMAEQLDH